MWDSESDCASFAYRPFSYYDTSKNQGTGVGARNLLSRVFYCQHCTHAGWSPQSCHALYIPRRTPRVTSSPSISWNVQLTGPPSEYPV
ncbi:hypothetical protein PISMIDRAFT_368748 [Pisolithus microcarpus 441]|uniref:Uncharacterized protein n=1 Tax=Pisolithus microcarpus 441 TaxID=765257 RepID=A0A0C9ZRT9_9AGAM|nr:hypothetical protein PISMIDRAFT_368748 [Pisolithus microcarpus 441]